MKKQIENNISLECNLSEFKHEIDAFLNPLSGEHQKYFPVMKREKKCMNCGKKKVKYNHFCPDYGEIYYCSMKCYRLYTKNNLYRSLELEKIK